MIKTKQASSTDNAFFIAALFCLFLTSFPLAQGWISFGDFVPRFLFLAFVAVSKPKLFMTKDVVWLGLFFLYMFISGGGRSLVEVSAIIMEFLVTIVISNYIICCKNDKHVRTMAWYAMIVTIIIMVSTCIVDFIRPGIVREMVYFGYSGELDMSNQFRRMGVCSYAFASISMCLAPVFLHLSSHKTHRLFYVACFALVCFFVYIAGISTCLLLLVFMLLIYILNRHQESTSSLIPSILMIGVVTYFAGFLIVEFLMPYFEGTTFYSHFAGLLEFFGKSAADTDVYDVGDRVDLYDKSLDSFLGNPFLGSATGKAGGHNYFLDKLARFGIIGTAPLFIFLYYRFKISMRFVPSSAHTVYIISIIGFFVLGFLKNMSGIEYWIYMFLYIPCILRVMEKGDVSKRIK